MGVTSVSEELPDREAGEPTRRLDLDSSADKGTEEAERLDIGSDDSYPINQEDSEEGQLMDLANGKVDPTTQP